MPRTSIIKFIKQINHTVFTTRELACVSGKSASVVTQALAVLARHGAVKKLYRGIWAEKTSAPLSPMALIPHLFNANRVYISFLSALHMQGIIEQIPQTITLATTGHSKTIKTALGTFIAHKISPEFFFGFDWHRGTEKFLIAEPEKALADSIYLFTRKKKQYEYFPEMNLEKPFDKDKFSKYIAMIPDRNARACALEKMKGIW